MSYSMQCCVTSCYEFSQCHAHWRVLPMSCPLGMALGELVTSLTPWVMSRVLPMSCHAAYPMIDMLLCWMPCNIPPEWCLQCHAMQLTTWAHGILSHPNAMLCSFTILVVLYPLSDVTISRNVMQMACYSPHERSFTVLVVLCALSNAITAAASLSTFKCWRGVLDCRSSSSSISPRQLWIHYTYTVRGKGFDRCFLFCWQCTKTKQIVVPYYIQGFYFLFFRPGL